MAHYNQFTIQRLDQAAQKLTQNHDSVRQVVGLKRKSWTSSSFELNNITVELFTEI